MAKGKAPADQFYWNEWERDLEEHPLEIAGAWLRICGKLWYSKTRGKMMRTVEQWARILRVDDKKAWDLLFYLDDQSIGDLFDEEKNRIAKKNRAKSSSVTFANKNITVVSRRMYRKWKTQENNRLRQERFRRLRENNNDITPLSSSSPSPSPLELGFSSEKPANAGSDSRHFSAKVGDQLKFILKPCKKISELPVKHTGKFNPYQWVQGWVNQSGHPEAIIYTLNELVNRWPDIDIPYKYGNTIMEIRSGNYHEKDHIKQAQKFKEVFDLDPEVKAILAGIGEEVS